VVLRIKSGFSYQKWFFVSKVVFSSAGGSPALGGNCRLCCWFVRCRLPSPNPDGKRQLPGVFFVRRKKKEEKIFKKIFKKIQKNSKKCSRSTEIVIVIVAVIVIVVAVIVAVAVIVVVIIAVIVIVIIIIIFVIILLLSIFLFPIAA
jgi:hypothetical protein